MASAADPQVNVQATTTDTRVPVTVLTGFLGSGKTTLLNRILTENHGKRIAVIENEFGEIGIDHELVIGADEEIFEMNNGCICCTVRGDLIRILGSLMKRRERFDYILVETTGMADPGPVAQTFFVDDEIQSRSKLDGIVTMIDAKHIWQHIDESDEAKAQVAFADVIVLNKADLVAPADLDMLETKMRSINAFAKVYRCENAVVPMEAVLDVGGFDLARANTVDPRFLEPEYPFEYLGAYRAGATVTNIMLEPGPDSTIRIAALPLRSSSPDAFARATEAGVRAYSEEVLPCNDDAIIANGHFTEVRIAGAVTLTVVTKPGTLLGIFTQHLPEEFALAVLADGSVISPERALTFKADHEHDSTVSSVGLVADRPLDRDRIGTWLRDLVTARGQDIFRFKGVLEIAGDPNRWVLQGVHMLTRTQPDRPWKVREVRRSQLVFIGRGLNRDQLNAGFTACLA